MTSFLEYTIALRAKLVGFAVATILLNSSCSDPATVGLELAPGNNQIGVFYEEFTLDAQLVLLDSFNTTNTGVLVVGNESDAFFGKTEATGYSRLFIDATQDRPEAKAILDSMFFKMDVVSVNGSALDKPKTYSIHKLTEPILDTLYYNFDELRYMENSFAESEFTFGEVKDSVIRLMISPQFQEELFGKMQEGPEFYSLINFREYFPGIAIKAKEGDNTTITVAPGSNTGISVYYHYDGDTVSKAYSISTYPARTFNGIRSDRSGTPTEVVTEYGQSYDVAPVVGMKSGVGMALRIDTSPLDAFLDTLSGITFNQVNFTIGALESQDNDNSPIAGMVMKFVDQNNEPIQSTLGEIPLYVQSDAQPQVVLDSNGEKVPNPTFENSSILFFDKEDRTYRAGITSHINAIYRGEIQRQNWLLDASIPSTPSLPASGIDFKRSLRQFKVNKDKITIKVIYSKSR